MEAIIFDLDGVLVDSMPTHVKAWQAAFEKVAGIKVSDRDIYLLEGMRGMDLIKKIFEQKGGDHSKAENVHDEKNKVFRSIRRSEPFEGAAELLRNLRCRKALVSGSARQDVETIIKEAFGKPEFDVVITADDVKVGKPDPTAFLEAAGRIGARPQDSVVVENAPLGANAAGRAGMSCYIALNNSPLAIDDFGKNVARDRVYETTSSLAKVLVGLCS